MICYFQHEKSRRVGHNEIIEKRKVFRKGYDTTGPNDERYYVSASSGIGGSSQDGVYENNYWPFPFQELMEARQRPTPPAGRRREISSSNCFRTKCWITTTAQSPPVRGRGRGTRRGPPPPPLTTASPCPGCRAPPSSPPPSWSPWPAGDTCPSQSRVWRTPLWSPWPRKCPGPAWS